VDHDVLGPFRVEVARTMGERRRGLRGRNALAPGTGMLFPRARSIHTLGMRFAITAVFLDAELRVIQTRRLPPRRVAWNVRARHVLEVGDATPLGLGDVLSRAGPGPSTTPDARGTSRSRRT
jgi:uncharacterized membrane protein (UPF0127 family)